MLKERLGKELLFLDGGMGTLLQNEGLKPGEYPESWNLEKPDVIKNIHKAYFEAGSNIVLTNTFGANRLKYHDERFSLQDVIGAAVCNAKEAAKEAVKDGRNIYVALDVGPTGKLLAPVGDLPFEEAYEAFREMVICGEKAGADLIYIETMSDTYEVKAAVLAAKENTTLPVFVTMIFDEQGKLLTGGDLATAVALLEGLRVDAIGMNCGLGPEQMIGLLRELRTLTSLPIIVKPNAGLPKQKDGVTYYDVEPEMFGDSLYQMVLEGAHVIGGCCGTTPNHIKEMVSRCRDVSCQPVVHKNDTVVSSYGQAVRFSDVPLIIGERINPTGKKKFKQALKEQDFDYILGEAFKQQDTGAHILDVNVGLPDVDETYMMKEAICRLQSVTTIPLQIDTVDSQAMEAAMRIYNGKPMINSVSGKQESMDAVFPLVQKYGGVVVGLTLDEEGIPSTADGRVAIAGKIVKEAAKYGIQPKDIVIDVLTMTISSEPEGAKVTLEALKKVRELYGVHTVLGVSNISFGLPNRAIINSYFYMMAMRSGLSAGIINPSSEEMMKAYHSYLALMNLDENCKNYIANYGNQETIQVGADEPKQNLYEAIEKGWKEEAIKATDALLTREKPLAIIDTYLIPALDSVGKGFESGHIFLPQLLMSAEAAKVSFDVLKGQMDEAGDKAAKKETILLATVKGDIHDIGKNIVKVLLENYGYEVLDLGKDVEPQQIVQVALEGNISVVGLSALMTTTVNSMEETIRQLREQCPACKVMVGGAVLNQEYADMIGADFYAKDAMQAVYYAQKIFGK